MKPGIRGRSLRQILDDGDDPVLALVADMAPSPVLLAVQAVSVVLFAITVIVLVARFGS
jgi:hypothetical protein